MYRLIVLVAMLFSFLSVTQVSAKSGPEELAYLARVEVLTEMGGYVLNDYSEHMGTYDGSAEWNIKLYGMMTTVQYIDKTVQNLDAPSSMEDIDKLLKSAFEHLRLATEYTFQGAITGDVSLIEKASQELTQGTEDLEEATKLLEALD